LLRLSRSEDALGAALAAVRHDQKYAKAHHRLGEALRALGREEEARRSFRQSEELAREAAKQEELSSGRGARAEDNLRFTDLTDGVDPLVWVSPDWTPRTSAKLTDVEVQASLSLASALQEKARVLMSRGKSLHAAACRLRVAAALFVSYELQREVLPSQKWAKKKAKAWKASVALGIDYCCDVADAAFGGREFGLALRAWRLALPYDGDGTAIDNKGGPHDYPNLRLNVGLALRDSNQYVEARAELQRAVAGGHPDAMVELGILLFTGKGGPEMREEAMTLFNRAMTEAREFANPQGRQPEYPCEYRRDQARTFINAVRQRGINVLLAPPS